MFCSGCGTQIRDDSKFCPKCGKPTEGAIIEEHKEEASQASSEPPASVPEPVPAAASAPATEEVPAKKSKKGLVIILTAVFVVIAAAVFVLIWINREHEVTDMPYIIDRYSPTDPIEGFYTGTVKYRVPNGNGNFEGTYGESDSGRMILSGQWEDGVLHGEGRRDVLFDGTLMNTTIGEFDNGYPLGKVELTSYHSDGSVTISSGDYSAGLNGQGKKINVTAEGMKVEYSGEFVNDELTGTGQADFYSPDGGLMMRQIGQFEAYLLNGQGDTIFYDVTGTEIAKQSGTWKNGELIDQNN